MPSPIARRSIFETCNFDSRFGYFFEWFDFYIQCKNEGISCAADAGAYFYHIPEKYANATSAQNCPRQIDRQDLSKNGEFILGFPMKFSVPSADRWQLGS